MSITATYVRTAGGGSDVATALSNLAARTLLPVGTSGVPAGGTLSWWAYERDASVETLWTLGDSGAGEAEMVVNLASPNTQFEFRDQAGTPDATDTGTVPPAGVWVHYAVTFNASTFKGTLYVNGAVNCEVTL